MYYEALQQLAHDRRTRLAEDARAERLAYATGRRQRRKRLTAQTAAQELLLDARRYATRLLST